MTCLVWLSRTQQNLLSEHDMIDKVLPHVCTYDLFTLSRCRRCVGALVYLFWSLLTCSW
jgi:hypothetical protein